MTEWLAPDLIFDGDRLLPGMALPLSRGLTGTPLPRAAAPAARPVGGILSPGFVDLQVNGGGGVLLNQTPTPDGMAAIAAAHRALGTAAILPTLITDAPEVLARAAAAAIAARDRPGIAGLHIEGPHIAPARRGTHDARFIRPLDSATIETVRALRAAGVRVMITLAPEACAPGQIALLAATGAIVSIGHSDATAPAVRAAIAEGAACFTHLFNAMSPLLHRAPGVVGAALNSHLPAGIICDGIHVADELVGLAIRARPEPDLMFLVSDAMPTVGGPDRFRLYDMDIFLCHGRLVNTEGSLAGAHVTMAESVARLVAVVGLPVETALRMAVTVPARVIGAPVLARIADRPLDEIVVLDPAARFTGRLADLAEAAA
jgi:N-acetylglucosamine-6-phosphate deacetylase